MSKFNQEHRCLSRTVHALVATFSDVIAKSVFIGLLIQATAVSAAATSSSTKPSPTIPTPTVIIQQLNQLRAQGSCKAYANPPSLQQAVTLHVKDMNQNDFVGSTGSDGSTAADRFKRVGYEFQFAAEAYKSHIDRLVDSWWADVNMKDMFLRCDYLDIALAYSTKHNLWYVVIAIPDPVVAVNPGSTGAVSDALKNIRIKVLELTNKERAKVGCSALILNDKLNLAAQKHTQDMLDNDFFDHTGSDGSDLGDRLQRVGYRFRAAAENIAAGYPTAEATVVGWMNSSGHRANILNCGLKELGVGYATSASAGYGAYWTQDFATSM